MSRYDDLRQWPFMNTEEFDLACAYFDQKYVKASMGPNRQIFKIRHRRIATTGNSYIEILRLLQLPDEPDELSAMLARLVSGEQADLEMQMDEDVDHVSCHVVHT